MVNMKIIVRISTVFLLFILCFLALSCSARQDIVMDLSGEGSGRAEISLHPVMVSYLTDLAMVMSSDSVSEELPVFDEVGIWNSFARNDSVELLSVEIPTRERVILNWKFTDLNKPFEDLSRAGQNVLSFSKAGERRIFELLVSGDNFYQISHFFPLMDDELMAYFGPDPENPVPEDIYREDLEFALEDYLEDVSLSEVLDDSKISLMVKIDGRIISQSGGTLVPGGVLFETPLIQFLTLNQPVSYRIEFSP